MIHPRKDYEPIQDPRGLIPKDEPVFLLRAQDKLAADTVRHWAYLNNDAGGDMVLSDEARKHADKMDAWPVKKLADLPVPEMNKSQKPQETEILEGNSEAADQPSKPVQRPDKRDV